MRGLITSRHIVTNAPTIIHEFGMGAYLRCIAACMFSRRNVTFLEVVMRLHGDRGTRCSADLQA